jgi:hypothetical protein
MLLFAGLALIGFTRLEDRAIFGAPGSPANAMAALAVPGASDNDETYSQPPDDSVAMENASRTPVNQIRRILRDRDVPTAASRQILAPSGFQVPAVTETQASPGSDPVVSQALAALEAVPGTFGSIAPPLAGQSNPVFATNLPGNGGTTGGGSGGGNGGTGGGAGPDGPVSPVPEPETWLMLLLGLFAIGNALRYRTAAVVNQTTARFS